MILFPQQILLLLLSPRLASGEEDPSCPRGFSGYRASDDCTSYFICTAGTLVAGTLAECPPGRQFNDILFVCDDPAHFECGTTLRPTPRPTRKPVVAPPTVSPRPTRAPAARSPDAHHGVEDALHHARRDVDDELFVYESGRSEWRPSTQYRFDGFLQGLRVMYLEGVGDLTFYLGAQNLEGTKAGLVNIAAFIAQCMKETIKYDACDENNWDIINAKYPLSNSCGQLGQSYQDYSCPPGSEHMQCDVDLDMELTATTQASWYGAPGPLFCGPKSKYPSVGYWDYSYTCDYSWKDPPEYCSDYPGQKGGRYVNEGDEGGIAGGVPNASGRTDVEGCCWWGRGVIQTTGICNFGMLNYYLGKRAADEGRSSRYPRIDFCRDPGAVCSRKDHPELKWIAGMFYWIRSLQTYNEGGWDYINKLKSFVRGGMTDDAFIDAVSGIVNRGCHNPPCGSGSLDGGPERKENFKKVLEILFEADGSPRARQARPSSSPEKRSRSTMQPVAALEDQEEEEDWSSYTSSAGSLLCGETRYDAQSNCNRNGYDCADGICHNGLKCFMVGDACNGVEEEETATPKPTRRPVPRPTPWPTPRPTPRPTVPLAPPTSDVSSSTEFDVTDTFFCGTSRVHASTSCRTRCRSGTRDECEEGETCFGIGVVCKEESKPRPTPTRRPAANPSPLASAKENNPVTENAIAPAAPVNNNGLREQFCAKSKSALPIACITAKICKTSDDCPSGTFCWPEHTCDTIKPPTPTIPVNNVGLREQFCAKSKSALPTACITAITCRTSDDCPSRTFCWPAITCGTTELPTPAPMKEFDVSNTFFCGTSRAHASSSCHKRCPSGTGDDCGEGETCFGYTDCEEEVESIKGPPPTKQVVLPPSMPPTKPPPTQPPTKQPMSKSPMTTNTNENDADRSPEAAPKPLPSPAQKPNNGSQPKPQELQLFCASKISELEASCAFAESCLQGPCPKGKFCFPFTCKGGEEDLPSTAADDHDDGKDENLVPTKDDRPARAENQQTSAPKELLPYEETSALDENQPLLSDLTGQERTFCSESTFVGWHASADCKEYYKCDNGAPGVMRVCGKNLKFDKVKNTCQSAESVNSFCYGPPLESTPEAQGDAPRDLCMEDYTGWHASADCKEYYKCDNGAPGVIRMCGNNLKFDKVRNTCYSEDSINSFCYGPPLESELGAQGDAPKDLCVKGYKGWHTSADCKEYYECDSGAPDVIRACGNNLKFDKVRNKCYSEGSVNSFCYGPPLESEPGAHQGGEEDGGNDSIASTDLCNSGYTGWEVRLGCQEYYWCNHGRADILYDCGEGLLFDQSSELCNFAHLVHCGSASLQQVLPPTSKPTSRPVNLSQNTPGLPNRIEDSTGTNSRPIEGVFGEHDNSNTPAPSPFRNQSEAPPWLMGTIMEQNSAALAGIFVCWMLPIFLHFVVFR